MDYDLEQVNSQIFQQRRTNWKIQKTAVLNTQNNFPSGEQLKNKKNYSFKYVPQFSQFPL